MELPPIDHAFSPAEGITTDSQSLYASTCIICGAAVLGNWFNNRAREMHYDWHVKQEKKEEA